MKIWIKRIAKFVGVIFLLIVLAIGYWLVRGEGRSIYVPYASMLALKFKALDTAESYAKEMLQAAEKNPNDWDYGNAIHNGNVIYGRIALIKGNIEEAKKRLIQAGKTPGSPQLDSFGPNMMLAKELLEKGEKKPVIEYLDLCKQFWKMDNGRLEAWKAEIQKGQVPDFEANLYH